MSFKWILVRIFLFLFGSRMFSKMLLQNEASATYKLFCKEVYGRDLCQANMVDEEQLQKLMQVMELKNTDQVLDLGCGLGHLSEYISDHTGASVLGVDFARKAIESTSNRTKANCGRLKFQYANLNKLSIPDQKFDVIVAVDSLYFVNDLEDIFRKLNDFLRPGGRIFAFYSSKNPEELGKALRGAGFRYELWNFTKNEHQIWQKTKTYVEFFRQDFILEGNHQLYKSRLAEAEQNLKWQSEGKITRYLCMATAER